MRSNKKEKNRRGTNENYTTKRTVSAGGGCNDNCDKLIIREVFSVSCRICTVRNNLAALLSYPMLLRHRLIHTSSMPHGLTVLLSS